MSPRELQDIIHCNQLPTSGDMTGYKALITGMYPSGQTEDFGNHLIREYNRKCYSISQTGLMLTPYDAGFRYTGTGNF